MDLAQSNSSTTQVGTARGTRIGRAAFAASVAAVVIITLFVAYALVPGSRTAPGMTTHSDPIVGPAAIEFRAGEREIGAPQADQLVGPAAIEFRTGEHGMTSTQSDALVGSSAIQFRTDERDLTNGLSDPLVGPAAIEFRAGEHE
jgi:hypothetical protein